ncbi:C-C motif chemokine 25b [Betta splendens]|uniref:C-C motif chemokine 25b n=1 Tax=Betta splendens TaxID=158456 RepID=A0A6P7M599_BETSP|nr:C-C motif chemokine 25b [Betta splendens]
MRFQALFFLLLLACMYLSLAQGSYGNCCLRYSRNAKKLHIKMVNRYWMQETDGDCNIRAVVVELKRRDRNNKPLTICVDPEMAKIRILVDLMESLGMRADRRRP